ncbi:hypothetical protein CBL_11323 [Carabus blaptoides fortunei]
MHKNKARKKLLVANKTKRQNQNPFNFQAGLMVLGYESSNATVTEQTAIEAITVDKENFARGHDMGSHVSRLQLTCSPTRIDIYQIALSSLMVPEWLRTVTVEVEGIVVRYGYGRTSRVVSTRTGQNLMNSTNTLEIFINISWNYTVYVDHKDICSI